MRPDMAFRCTSAGEPPYQQQYRQGQVHQHPPPAPPAPAPQRQPPMAFQHSGYGSFDGQQPTGAGYRSPNFGLGTDYLSTGVGLRQGNGLVNENFRSLDIAQEEILRAIEKERIREEIIAAEIFRRRMLEAEVRAELRIERELALRVREGSAFDKVPYLVDAGIVSESRGVPCLQKAKGLSLEERIAMNAEEKLRMQARFEAQGFNVAPFQQRSTNSKAKEAIPFYSGTRQQKERIIFVPVKPGANLSGAKSKVLSTSEKGDNMISRAENIKGNGVWGCETCGVHTTSECVLNEHIQGKKHKAALLGKRNGYFIGLGVLPNNNLKPIREVTRVLNPTQEVKSGGEGLQIGLSQPSSLHVAPAVRLDENSASIMAENAKNKKPKESILQKGTNKPKEKNDFMFWCDMCQVGVDHEKVMEEHRHGKKHVKSVLKAKENGQAILIPQIIGSQGENVSNEATKGANQGLVNVDTKTKKDHVQNKDLDPNEKAKQEMEIELLREDPTMGCRETNVKHTDDLFGTKSEDVSLAEESANQLFSIGNTKENEVWNSEICGVSTNSDHVLNEHVQGEKHKAALNGKEKDCCIRLGVLLNNNLKPIMEVIPQDSGKEHNSGEEALQIALSDPPSLISDIVSTLGLDENSGSIVLENTENKMQGEKILPKADNKLKEKNISTFWCDMCQVGVDHEKGMEDHLEGKKHAKSLQKAIGQAMLIPQMTAIQGENDFNEATKGDNEASDGTAKVERAESKDLNANDNVKQEVESNLFGDAPTWDCRETNVKPVADLSGTESIAVSPSEEGANHLFSVKNTEGNGVWSCEICGISTTCERLLQEHIQGRKHKSKEAALKKENNGSNILQRRTPPGNNFMFWCDLCRVGADHEKVMEDHRNGKKHKTMELLQKARKDGQANLSCSKSFTNE